MASTNWENLPSTNTPLNATNLNKIETKTRTYFIPTNTAQVTGWYLVASGNIIDYNNNAFKLSIQQLYSESSGILYINIRCDNSTSLSIKKFIWEANTGIDPNAWRLKLDGNNYYLYCKCLDYQKFQIKVLEASDLMNNNENILTIYQPSTSDAVQEPTGTNSKIKEDISVTSYLTNGDVTAKRIGNIVIVEIHGSMENQIPNTWENYAVAKLNGITANHRMTTPIVDQVTGLCADAFIDSNSDTIYMNKRGASSINGGWLRGELIFICN